MLSTRTARWSAVTGLVCVIVLVATWFVLVGPRRSEAAGYDDQRVEAEAANVTLQSKINELRKQFGDLQDKRDELARIRGELPPAADVADLVRSLSGLADASGVTITAITPGTATALTPASAAGPAVVSIPVTVELSGTYTETTRFLRFLQTRIDRAFLLTELSTARGTGDTTGTTGSLTSGTTAASVSASPTASPTATATTTSTTTSTATATSTTTSSPSLVDAFETKVTGEVFSLADAPSAAPSAPAATPTPATTS
jgi:type IV pilus assembly protein PilO